MLGLCDNTARRSATRAAIDAEIVAWSVWSVWSVLSPSARIAISMPTASKLPNRRASSDMASPVTSRLSSWAWRRLNRKARSVV